MATINLRGDLATGTTLTFAQVDGNFTNINNELIDVNWNDSTGVVTFTPVGSATDAVTYPVVTIDLDAKYTKRASDSDLSQMNIIKDYNNGIDQVQIYTSSDGWVSPLEKLHIDHPKSFLINSPAFNTDNDRLGNGNYLDGDEYTLSFYKEDAIDQGDHLTHWRNANEVVHNTSTTVKINLGFLKNGSGGAVKAGINANYSSIREFMSAIASLDSNIHGSEIVLYSLSKAEDTDSTDYRVSGTITGVTFENYGSGYTPDVPEYAIITFTVIDRGVNMNASSTTYCGRIDFILKPSQVGGSPPSPSMGIYAPRAPLVPPLTGSHGPIEDKVARVLAVNRHADLMDKSDISLRYADYDDLLVGGLRTRKDFTITPFFAGEYEDLIGGLSNGGEYEVFRKIIAADGITEDTDGGNVTVHGGNVVVDTSVVGNKPNAGDLRLSGGYLLDSDPANLLSGISTDIDNLHSQGFSKVGAPSIELEGQLGTTNASRMILNAGVNYIKTKNDRDGNDILINLGTPTGTGEPGTLTVKLLGPPNSSTTSSDLPILNTNDTPWKIDWNPLAYKYRIESGKSSYLVGYDAEVDDDGSIGTRLGVTPSVSATAGSVGNVEDQYHRTNMLFCNNSIGILREPASLNTLAHSYDNPFYSSGIVGLDSITTSMKEYWQEAVFKGTGLINGKQYLRSCIATSKYLDFNSDTMDDAAYSNGYDGVYERIAPSLNIFAGSTEDYDHVLTRNDGSTTALERTGGETISLGQYGLQSQHAVFLAGFVVDGRTIRIKGQSIEIDGDTNVVGDITATGDVTAFSDESIKENVEVIEDAVDKVQQLNGYTFDRTDVETSRQTGVIAQEVLKVLPEAVGEKDGLHTVAYGNMVGLLIEAIKEQQGQIDSLKEELQSIKSINK